MTYLRPRRSIQKILGGLPLSKAETQEERQALCDYIGYAVMPDARMQVWDVKAAPRRQFTVYGAVSNPFGLRALEKAAEILDGKCDTGPVAVLPDPNPAARRMGVATEARCPLVDSPESDEKVDSAIFGGLLHILRREETHSLVQAETGYVGWAENRFFREIDADEWLRRIRAVRAFFRRPWSQNGLTVEAGTELPFATPRSLWLPDGSEIPAEAAGDSFMIQNNEKPRKGLIKAAKSLLGVRYDWGGVSGAGIDCSGFARYVYRAVGVLLPRDADQQFLLGTISALPGLEDGMKTGDLLFFSGDYGGVSHVAMALNGEEFIHASGQDGVCITRLDREPRLRERFLLAKRVIR